MLSKSVLLEGYSLYEKPGFVVRMGPSPNNLRLPTELRIQAAGKLGVWAELRTCGMRLV